MDEVEQLKEQLDKAEKFISQFEKDCCELIDEIIDAVCKNVIDRMNTELRTISMCDDFPQSFTFFDQLSVLHQSRSYDEIDFPTGMLENYIDNIIDSELSKLSAKDKTILWYANYGCTYGDNYQPLDANEMCYQRFNDFQNKRYEELLSDLDWF